MPRPAKSRMFPSRLFEPFASESVTSEDKPDTVKILMSSLAVNRKARFDYAILTTYEAGLELHGFEVKSVKLGHVTLAGSFVVMRNGEALLVNATISPYQAKNTPPRYDPHRSRRLLLHKSEIRELIGKSQQKGLTLVPLSLYTKHSRVKLEFGLARRRKKSDKREVIKKRDAEQEMRRTL